MSVPFRADPDGPGVYVVYAWVVFTAWTTVISVFACRRVMEEFRADFPGEAFQPMLGVISRVFSMRLVFGELACWRTVGLLLP